MTPNPLRRWIRSYLSPRRPGVRTPVTRLAPKRPSLSVERFEDRACFAAADRLQHLQGPQGL